MLLHIVQAMWAEITGALGSSARHCGTLSSEDNKQGGAFGLAWLGKVLVSHAARRGERLGETKHAQQASQGVRVRLRTIFVLKKKRILSQSVVGRHTYSRSWPDIGALSYAIDPRHIPKNLVLLPLWKANSTPQHSREHPPGNWPLLRPGAVVL